MTIISVFLTLQINHFEPYFIWILISNVYIKLKKCKHQQRYEDYHDYYLICFVDKSSWYLRFFWSLKVVINVFFLNAFNCVSSGYNFCFIIVFFLTWKLRCLKRWNRRGIFQSILFGEIKRWKSAPRFFQTWCSIKHWWRSWVSLTVTCIRPIIRHS